MRRVWGVVVSLGLVLGGVSVAAYEPPYPGLADAIRAYTEPDILFVVVNVHDDCDVDHGEVDGLIESEMIRARVERTEDRGVALGKLWVLARCLRTSSDQYVYDVTAELSVYVLDPLGRIGRGSTMSILIDGSLGIAPSADDIRDAMVSAAEYALTDFIYAHSNNPDE